jgi:iron(III) transport system substrate-binding protein
MSVSTFRPRPAGLLPVLAAVSIGLGGIAGEAQADEVNVYTTRQPDLIQPLFDAFTEETGIAVNALFGGEELVERIRAEGRNSPADMLVTVDIGTLQRAVDAGISQPIESEVVADRVPEHLRDAERHWVGLSMRARIVVAARDRVEQDSITYEELADPKWDGRICTRPGQHNYNIALFASMIAHHGEDYAEEWLQGLRDNLAMNPSGNDRGQARNVHAGACDIALMNTYYMGLMETNEEEPEQQEWADGLKVLFPNAGDRGTHVNISGAILARHAPNEDAAIRLVEFMTSDQGQAVYAEINHEYPVVPGVPVSETVAAWGELVVDELPLSTIAANRAAASELVDKVGYENGPRS